MEKNNYNVVFEILYKGDALTEKKTILIKERKSLDGFAGK